MSQDMTREEAVVIEAITHAANATRAFLTVNGDRDACGFAWVTVYKVRSNSKLGKVLTQNGFRKSYYEKGLQLWNPAKSGTQSISALEAGAEACARVLREKLGVEAYAGSRLD